MALKIGADAQQRAEATDTGSIMDNQLKIEEGDNVYRFISGPVKSNVIFLPTIKEVEENGEKFIKPSFMAINFNTSAGILEQCFSVEAKIRQELGEQKPDYAFKPQLRWFFLAIDLKDKSGKSVKPIKVPNSIKDEIISRESKPDPMDPEILLNGHYFLYNTLITKTVDPKKPKRYGTSYSSSIYGNNPFQGKIPISYLNNPGDVLKELGLETIFVDEDIIEAIESCTIDLAEELKPMNEAQIREKLVNNPINLKGVKANASGKFIFPQVEAMKEALENLGIPTVEFNVNDQDTPRQTEAPKQSVKSGGLDLKSLKKEETKEVNTNEKEETSDEDSTSEEKDTSDVNKLNLKTESAAEDRTKEGLKKVMSLKELKKEEGK